MGWGSFVRGKYLCVLIHIKIKGGVGARKTGLGHPREKYYTDHSGAVLLLWIFCLFFCLVFAVPLYAYAYMCFVVTCWEMTDLSFVVSSCEFVTFPLVSWVRCGT